MRYTPIGREGNEQLRVYKPRTHAPKTNTPVNTGIHARNTEEIENPHAFVSPGMPRSVLPYRGYTTDQHGREVRQEGKRRLVIERRKKAGRRVHWLVWLGLGAIGTLGLISFAGWAINAIQEHNLDSQYGFPRTFQVDEVVGHNDSPSHPTHFIALNLHGRVEVIEMPGGQAQGNRVYQGPPILTANGQDASIPVTLEFADVNGDGKRDMEVHVEGMTIVFLNDGKQFNPQK